MASRKTVEIGIMKIRGNGFVKREGEPGSGIFIGIT
jgi:hypothetical protein